MRFWLKTVVIWIVVLVGLVFLMVLVPAAKTLPDWIYTSALLAAIVVVAIIRARKRARS